LYLVCFYCGQCGHIKKICPRAKNFNQEEAKEDGMLGNDSVAMICPEVIESFDN